MQQERLMPSKPFYRIDKFVVPPAAMEKFMGRLRATHRALDDAEGCQKNLVLEQVSGMGAFNVVTFVEWRDAAAYEVAKTATQEHYAATGFDPKHFMDELGVKADLGNYMAAAWE
jgi:heme-degrading monooxygenase HmoA